MQNKRLLSFKHAIEGLVFIFKTQTNMKIHFILTCFAIALSWYLKISKTEWLWIILSIFFVVVTETVNTAIERVVDLVTQDFNPIAKQAKDCAAAAVLLASIFTVCVASFIFIPKLQ